MYLSDKSIFYRKRFLQQKIVSVTRRSFCHRKLAVTDKVSLIEIVFSHRQKFLSQKGDSITDNKLCTNHTGSLTNHTLTQP